jgi:tetratricopeptide (TPR) repeat protein
VFSWSCRALTPAAARLFRFLGMHPGPDISATAAASLLGCPVPEVRLLLTELTSTYLITERSPGRYDFHDLLRAYADEQAHTIDPDDQRHAAIRRVLGYYLHSAYAASLRLEPHQDPIAITPPEPGSNHETPDDAEQALAWFTAEHQVLLAAARHAITVGLDMTAWQLPWALSDFLDRLGRWYDLAAIQNVALAAAQRLGDQHAESLAHRAIARAYTALGLADDALAHLEQALSLSAQAEDVTGQAHSHHNLAFVQGRQLRHAEALQHSLRALELYKAAGHARGHARALNAVGWYYAQLSEYRQAIAYCRRALAEHEELGNQYGQAGAWDSLGYAYGQLGLHAEALDCYAQALTLYRDLGDRWNVAETLTRLGDVHRATGHTEAARQAWLDAMAVSNELDQPANEQIQARLCSLEIPPRHRPGGSRRR